MSKRRVRSLRVMLGTSAGLAAVVGAAPPALDTESRAQASLSVPLYLSETLAQDVSLLAGGAQRIAQYALQLLDDSTTYDIIAASPGGIAVACSSSGNLTVRASTAPPRILQIDFQNCARENTGLVNELMGAAEIRLFRKTLAPESVAGIRLGTSDQDLLERFFFASSPGSAQIRSRNLRVTGKIPVRREDSDFEYYGTLVYQLTGFYQFTNSQTLPDGTVASSGVRYSAEGLAVSGHRFERHLGDLQIFDFTFQYSGGLVSSTFFDTQSGIDDTRSASLGDLEVRSLSVYRGNDSQSLLEVNGSADMTWAAGNGAGCVDGEYDIRTSKAWLYSSEQPPYQFTDGASQINDTVSVRFTGRPAPAIRLNVHDVGNFRYEDSVQSLVSALPCAW